MKELVETILGDLSNETVFWLVIVLCVAGVVLLLVSNVVIRTIQSGIA